MPKPEHDAWCDPGTRPHMACPACAWEEAVEVTLDAIQVELRNYQLVRGPADVDLVDIVRERVK